MSVRDTSDDPLAGLSADELLRVLGHEIGNLVTIVSGYGQMLRDHWASLADDRGPGIPAGERERIFEKFVRLQDGGVGVGLGLFISRALVEAMGGRIWAADAPDGGARMSFTLPVPS